MVDHTTHVTKYKMGNSYIGAKWQRVEICVADPYENLLKAVLGGARAWQYEHDGKHSIPWKASFLWIPDRFGHRGRALRDFAQALSLYVNAPHITYDTVVKIIRPAFREATGLRIFNLEATWMGNGPMLEFDREVLQMYGYSVD